MGGHYERDIFRQLEELTEKNEQLKQENQELRRENRQLRKENARLEKRLEILEATMEDRISKAVEAAVAKATAPMLEMIAKKDKEILRLKGQIEKDSSNSSKPTSSNGFKKVPNNREKSGRKQGGRTGHKGTKLKIPENPDELVEQGVAEHSIISDVQDGEAYVSDWIVDIKVRVVYTEHRRRAGKLPKIEYGPEVKTLAVYLSMVGLIALKRLSQFFEEITRGFVVASKGTLASFNHNAAQSITLDEEIQDLLNGRVIHVDETPIKTSERPNEDGELETSTRTTYSVYIRTYSNKKTTVLMAASRKTEKSVINDNILPHFHGIVSQDHETKFYRFGDSHATCGAHLTRELKGLAELYMLPWAEKVRKFFIKMNQKKNNDVHRKKTACGPGLLRQFETHYDKLAGDGKTLLDKMPPKAFVYDRLRRMVNRFADYKNSYLLFIRGYEAPFTNNEAERDLRPCKTKQKISECFRSWQGVLDYCKIRSFLATSKKRDRNLLDTLASCFSQPLPAGQ